MSFGQRLTNPFLKQTPFKTSNAGYTNSYNSYSNFYGTNDNYSNSNTYGSNQYQSYNNYDALIYRLKEQSYNKYGSYASNPSTFTANNYYGSAVTHTSHATFSKFKQNAYDLQSPYLGTNQYKPGITEVVDYRKSSAGRQFQYGLGKCRENDLDQKYSLREGKDLREMLDNNPFSRNNTFQKSQASNKQINYQKYEKLQHKPNFLLGTSNVSYAPSYDNYQNEDYKKPMNNYLNFQDDRISDDRSSTSNTYINKIMDEGLTNQSPSFMKTNPFQRKQLFSNKNQMKQSQDYRLRSEQRHQQYENKNNKSSPDYQIPTYEKYTQTIKKNPFQASKSQQNSNNMKQSYTSKYESKNYRKLNLEDSYQRSEKSDKFQMANFKRKYEEQPDFAQNQKNRQNYDKTYENQNTEKKIDEKYQSLRYKRKGSEQSQKFRTKYNDQNIGDLDFNKYNKNPIFQDRESLKVINYLDQSQKYQKSGKFKASLDTYQDKNFAIPQKESNKKIKQFSQKIFKQPSFGSIKYQNESKEKGKQLQKQNTKNYLYYDSENSSKSKSKQLPSQDQQKFDFKKYQAEQELQEHQYELSQHKNIQELPTINEAYQFKDMDEFQKQYDFNFNRDQFEEQFIGKKQKIPANTDSKSYLKNTQYEKPNFQNKNQILKYENQLNQKQKERQKISSKQKEQPKQIMKQKLYETDEEQFRLSSDYDNVDLQFNYNAKYKSPFDTKIQQGQNFNKKKQDSSLSTKSQKKIAKLDDNEEDFQYYSGTKKKQKFQRQMLPSFGKIQKKQKQKTNFEEPIKDKKRQGNPTTLQFRGSIYYKVALQSQQ